jgi:ribosomal protein S18 acetylase RimI-like enzyme
MTDQPNELFTVMVRDTLDDVPNYPLPVGYSARWYQPGDEQAWIDIHGEGHTAELFWREFPDAAALAERQVYILDAGGSPVATSTAWLNNNGFDERYGCVHWVAVAPQAQRQGLAKAMLTLILERFKALGYTRAYLRTENPLAVNLYEQFGFVVLSMPPSD